MVKYEFLVEDYQEFLSPVRRPRYFIFMKYSLISYILIHLLWITVSLPYGIADLKRTEHEHTKEIHVLWIISIVYCTVFSVIGLIGILKENFILCFIFSVSMVVNLLILVYGATLHKNQTTGMITALIFNWFFASVVIAFTKLIDSFDHTINGESLLETVPGFLHNIYIRTPTKETSEASSSPIVIEA